MQIGPNGRPPVPSRAHRQRVPAHLLLGAVRAPDARAAATCRWTKSPLAMPCDPAAPARVRAAGGDPDELVDWYVDAINEAVKGRPAELTVGVHMSCSSSIPRAPRRQPPVRLRKHHRWESRDRSRRAGEAKTLCRGRSRDLGLSAGLPQGVVRRMMLVIHEDAFGSPRRQGSCGSRRHLQRPGTNTFRGRQARDLEPRPGSAPPTVRAGGTRAGNHRVFLRSPRPWRTAQQACPPRTRREGCSLTPGR